MAHHVRIRLDPSWAIGTFWTSAEQTSLDNALFAAVNGDGGGTWTPTADVVIGGAGMRILATTHTLSGAHSSVTTDGATKLLVHNDSDYCVLGSSHSGANATIAQPIGLGTAARGWGVVVTLPLGNSILQLLNSNFLNLLIALELGAAARLDLRVHDGATFTTLALPFQVFGDYVSAGTIPTKLPRVGVFAADTFGNTFPLSVGSPYQTIPAPASPTAWVAGNATQTLTYTADSASDNPYVVMDTSKFYYFAELVEIDGPGAILESVEYFDFAASFTNITDIRPR